MRRDRNPSHRVGMASQLLRARPHVIACVDQGVNAAIIQRPPLAALTLSSVGGIAHIGGNGLPSEVICVSLQRPIASPEMFGSVSKV